MLIFIAGALVGALWMDLLHSKYEKKLEREIIKWRSGHGRWQQ